MIYICVRTYDNGKCVDKVYGLWFNQLSQAARVCEKLNKTDAENGEIWIMMPMNEFVGEVWEK